MRGPPGSSGVSRPQEDYRAVWHWLPEADWLWAPGCRRPGRESPADFLAWARPEFPALRRSRRPKSEKMQNFAFYKTIQTPQCPAFTLLPVLRCANGIRHTRCAKP